MMKAISYRMKKINSDVPLYDKKNKTFGILVNDELVEVPEDTFHLLFEEGREYVPALDIQLYVKEELKNIENNQPEVLEKIKQASRDNMTKDDMLQAMDFFIEAEGANSEDYKFFISELIEFALTKKE